MIESTLDGKTKDIVQDNIEQLKQIFPEIITEDKIDFDKLKEVLGEEIDDINERYDFTWKGKHESVKISQIPSEGTLRPSKEDSKNWDTTENLYIEGDNLEVLKILQKAYYGKVKMIYIDPPYNTGKDFVYKDDFKDNLKNYIEQDEEGFNVSSNPETSGRYHTNWLNMMYPRLKLARNLLTDDGVIFISIDDNEVTNLKNICDEIYGESNYVGKVIRKTKTMNADKNTGLNSQQDYVLIYSKTNKTHLKGDKKDFSNYINPDNDPNGLWCSADPSAKSGGDATYFSIENPYTHKIDYPPNGRFWAFSKNTLEDYIKTGRIIFKKEYKNNERGFIFKRYINKKNMYNHVNSLFAVNNDFLNEKGTKDCKSLFNKDFFDYPKPTKLIKKLIEYSCTENDIIMDFFAGSSTTAESVMKINNEDDGNRKFIMVQLPEQLSEKSNAYKDGFKNICEIGKERIRRAGDRLLEENPKSNIDIGFKVFKLDSSNLTKWNPDVDNLEESLIAASDNIVEGRSELDLAYEIMLKYGIELTAPVENLSFGRYNFYSVGMASLIICLNDHVTREVTNDILKIKDEYEPDIIRVVFKDNGFENDSDKTNVKEILKNNEIDEFITI